MATPKLHIRRPYDASAKVAISFPSDTMAKQSFKDECDINTIMSKYQRTGIIDHVQKVQGSYGDFANVADYQLHLNQVLQAQDAFDQLPAKIRERFNNDPAHLMRFLEDGQNLDEAIALGLVEPPSPPQPKAPAGPSGEGGTPSTNHQETKSPPPKETP